MKKLNNKYVESVVKKAVDDKIVAVHREKTLEHGPNREKQETRGKKRKIVRPTWKPGPNQPWKSMVISNKKYHENK